MGDMTASSFTPASLHAYQSTNQIIMALNQKDLEMIERVIYKNGDDVAISMGRSFERLEERIDAAESRLYSRLLEIEDMFTSKA